jgi:hypothetical protein
MAETQQSICRWGVDTFGVGSALATATRMNVEVAELLSDLGGHQDQLLSDLLTANNSIAEALSNRANWLEGQGLLADRTPNGKECADIQVVLYQVAERCNVILHEATDEKMAVNRARQWKLTRGGRFQHT